MCDHHILMGQEPIGILVDGKLIELPFIIATCDHYYLTRNPIDGIYLVGCSGVGIDIFYHGKWGRPNEEGYTYKYKGKLFDVVWQDTEYTKEIQKRITVIERE